MTSPVPGVVIELRSDRLTRYATADREGRFVFDGLAKGAYTLSASAFDRSYPANPNRLAGPLEFSLESKSCGFEVLVVPADSVKQEK
jgi:hypothetical protein